MNERITLATELNVFADFKPKLPGSLSDRRAIFFWRISIPTLQRSVLHQVKTPRQSRGARHHELLDRTHAQGTARDPASTPTS